MQAAARGLTILAAGGKYGKLTDLRAYVMQVKDTGGFWASVYELNASHPYLPKRIAALLNSQRPGLVPAVGRNPLAYPLAPFFGVASTGGSAPLVMVAMVGIMAAIAIPQFEAYRSKVMLDSTLVSIQKSAQGYREKNGHWPCSEAELNMPQVSVVIAQKNWRLDTNCERNFASLGFKKGGADHYKIIDFNTGEIQEVPPK